MNRFVPLALALSLAACSQDAVTAATMAASDAPAIEASSAAKRVMADAGPISRYTRLKDCKLTASKEDEDWSTSRCKGFGGYSLVVNYSDAREGIEIHRNGIKLKELDLSMRAGGGFNGFGDTVEWRGSRSGEGFVPTRMIVRNRVITDPEHPDKATDLLEVIDLGQGCVIGEVKPMNGQNEAARKLADGPSRPCLASGEARR